MQSHTEQKSDRESLDERIAELVAEALFNHMARKGLLKNTNSDRPSNPIPSRTLVTVKELSEILKVAPSWIYQRTRLGPNALPHIRLGKYMRFDPEQVIRFLTDKAKVS